MSTISWSGQVTAGSFVRYWSIIRVSHCSALDKETALKGWYCCLQFFCTWIYLEAAIGIRYFTKGILSPWHSLPLHPHFPLPAQMISTTYTGTQSLFGLVFSCSPLPCAHNFLLEGTAQGAYTWHIWHVFSVERYRKANLDPESTKEWTVSWTNLCLQVGWSWGNYLRLHLVNYDTGIIMYIITWAVAKM